jgi:hypothetical protein
MLVSITVDHAIIRAWAERRQARPATFEGDERPWPLLFNFGPPPAGVVTISWEKFFEEFERAGLAFLYSDTTPNGQIDNFYELVERAAVPELISSGLSTIVEQVI